GWWAAGRRVAVARWWRSPARLRPVADVGAGRGARTRHGRPVPGRRLRPRRPENPQETCPYTAKIAVLRRPKKTVRQSVQRQLPPSRHYSANPLPPRETPSGDRGGRWRNRGSL